MGADLILQSALGEQKLTDQPPPPGIQLKFDRRFVEALESQEREYTRKSP